MRAKFRSIAWTMILALSLEGPAWTLAQETWTSAVPAAMAGAGIARPGLHGLLHNPAAGADLADPEAWLLAEDRFALGIIRQLGLALGLPLPQAGLALALGRYGNEAYREHTLGVTYARHLHERLAIGLTLGFRQTFIPDHGQHLAPQAGLAFQWALGPKVRLAGSLFNPFRVYRSAWNRLPTWMGVGLQYSPYPSLQLLAEVVQEREREARFRLGLEYRIADLLTLRLGVRPDPPLQAFGAGIRLLPRLRLDLSAQWADRLPPNLTLGLHWRRSGWQSVP